MRNKPILYTTLLFLATFTLISAAPPADRGAGKNDQLVEDADSAKEKRSWLDRVLGRETGRAAQDEAEKQREANEERAEAARERKETEKKVNKDKAAQSKFTTEERAVLEDWQRGEASWKKSGKKLPPGLQKKVDRGGELPPGWKKKLAVGDKLPEEYETQAQSLPEEILKRLPKTNEGTEILRIGDEVIRVMENTREIVDILGIGQGGVQN